MHVKHFLFLLLISGSTMARGQTAFKKFEKFASRQDSLFYAAAEKKDVKQYNKLLAEFLSEYYKLPEDDQKSFADHLTGAYYNLSCTYSLLGNKALALAYFKKSVSLGYTDYAQIKEDKDLDNIRDEEGFKEEMQKLRSVGDYLFILKRGAKYNKDTRPLPGFTYQPANNANLTALRKAFNLDSVAGNEGETPRILNLLHWVHYLIPHDGSHNNPVVKNAMSMMAECKRDKRGLNCRGLALVLNECYLALGIRSRIVTCSPKDSLKTDPDCHVINMVYAENLKKWLYIDPTNDAYIMNEKEELLSIEEVRERLINEKPMVVNPGANWNKEPINKKDYLYRYMTKNLYMLESPANSEYDIETRQKGKVITYIKLLPLDYFAQSPDKEVNNDIKNKTTLVTYKTNNPELFWALP